MAALIPALALVVVDSSTDCATEAVMATSATIPQETARVHAERVVEEAKAAEVALGAAVAEAEAQRCPVAVVAGEARAEAPIPDKGAVVPATKTDLEMEAAVPATATTTTLATTPAMPSALRGSDLAPVLYWEHRRPMEVAMAMEEATAVAMAIVRSLPMVLESPTRCRTMLPNSHPHQRPSFRYSLHPRPLPPRPTSNHRTPWF